MDDIADVVCAFCGAVMGLSREVPASTHTHALRFFSCDTCGASELRLDRAATDKAQKPGPTSADGR
jgi:hypothetical protein